MIEIEIKVLRLFYGLLMSQPTINRAYDCLKVLFEKTIENYENGFEEKVTYSRQQLKVAVDGKLSAERMDSKELGKWINDSRLNDFLKCIIQRHRAVFDELGYIPFVNTNDTKGGKGNERIYWLEIKKLQQKSMKIMRLLKIVLSIMSEVILQTFNCHGFINLFLKRVN